MSEEHTTHPDQASIPMPKRELERNWLPSLIWLIPIVAALVGIALVVKIVAERGPVITIAFRTAEGLEAGKTKVKYKEVDIGDVQSITLSEDRSQVLVTVQLAKQAKSFTSADTHFWVVRPQVAASGVSGLSTLLSGAYIGADAGTKEESADHFTGLETPPIVTRDASGKRYKLHASDLGSLDIGSPVLYRRIKVGQVAAFELDKEGKGVNLDIFINTPYDKFVGMNTRFWHASGIDVQVNSSGFKLNTQSLATVVLGGLAFQSIDDNPGDSVAQNTTFLLAQDQDAAFKEPDGEAQSMVLYFKQSIRGLTPGATVDFRGVVVGEVKSIGIQFDAQKREFAMPVVIEVYPGRLGRKFAENERKSAYTMPQRMQLMIDRGLRAQLRTGNLLTGQLYVAFDFFPNAPKIKTDPHKLPVELPTIPNGLDELQTQIATIAGSVSKVPFEQIGKDLQKTLATLNSTLVKADKLAQSLNEDVAPEVTAAMKDVRKTLKNADQTLSNADLTLSQDAPLQQDLRQTLQELSRAAASLKVLTDYLEQHPESLIRGKPADVPTRAP